MELGATVCTPKSPSCDVCPVRAACMAHAEATGGGGAPEAVGDVEDGGGAATACTACLPGQGQAAAGDVAEYPRKAVRKQSPTHHFAVAVLVRGDAGSEEVLLRRRDGVQLLGGQWEPPSVQLEAAACGQEAVDAAASGWAKEAFAHAAEAAAALQWRGLCAQKHVFTHLKHQYVCVWARAPVDLGAPAEGAGTLAWTSVHAEEGGRPTTLTTRRVLAKLKAALRPRKGKRKRSEM